MNILFITAVALWFINLWYSLEVFKQIRRAEKEAEDILREIRAWQSYVVKKSREI
jgi:hypothetical protein